MEINIDTKQYRIKPENEWTVINNRVANNVEDLSLEEIIERVGNKGYAFTRARLYGGRQEENFGRQIFLVLDFDDGMEDAEFRSRCKKYQVPYLFTYRTLSWKKNDNRFRAVFLLDEWIENKKVAKMANVILRGFFPESDKSCIDLSRIFLGGKKVTDIDMEARVTVTGLARSLEEYCKDTKKSNYARDLGVFGKKINVYVQKGELCVYDQREYAREQLDEIDNKIIDGNIFVVLNKKGVNGKEIDIKGHAKMDKVQEERKRPKKRVLVKYDKESLSKLCPLFRDFAVEADEIDHDLKFKLALSLQYIKGGREWFMESIADDPLSYAKWSRDWENTIPGYWPEKCASVKSTCPYFEQCGCDSLYGKAVSKIRRIEKKTDYYELQESVDELRRDLQRAVDSSAPDIYVIKAQTAIGKTEQYANIVRDNKDKKFIIAVPTIALQHEVAERIEGKGVICEVTKSMLKGAEELQILELTNELEKALRNGFWKKVKGIISKYKREHSDELSAEQKDRIDQDLKKMEVGQSGARCIVTTHALFLMKELYKMKDYEIIIDEDILRWLLNRSDKLSVGVLKQLLKSDWVWDCDKKEIRKILNLENGQTGQISFGELTDIKLEKIYQHCFRENEPIAKFFDSTYFYREKEYIHFCAKKEFAGCEKMIVLSATADKKLYTDYFSSKNIDFRETHPAKYKGRLIQYTAYSMSRAFLERNGEEDIIHQIQKQLGEEMPVITFKKLALNSEIHFGKVEGFDGYKGRDIAVIGTPHKPPVVYKLAGAMFGYDTTGELNNYQVEKNGFSYTMMTYKDKDMQNLQLYFIESELEQAIGRARLLRYDCTVYLYSNYPCQQAELHDEPYLELKPVEDENDRGEEVKEEPMDD